MSMAIGNEGIVWNCKGLAFGMLHYVVERVARIELASSAWKGVCLCRHSKGLAQERLRKVSGLFGLGVGRGDVGIER